MSLSFTKKLSVAYAYGLKNGNCKYMYMYKDLHQHLLILTIW